jgi:hypothetical protein
VGPLAKKLKRMAVHLAQQAGLFSQLRSLLKMGKGAQEAFEEKSWRY